MEGEELLLERLDVAAALGVAEPRSVALRDRESRRRVHEIRRREEELDRGVLENESGLFAIRGEPREVVPADREASLVAQPSTDRDRRRPRVARPRVDIVDRCRVAGEMPDLRELVDDAAQQYPGVEALQVRGRATERRRREPVAGGADGRDRGGGQVVRWSQELRVREL